MIFLRGITIFLLLAAVFVSPGWGESVRSLNREGIEAYGEGDYEKALSRFRKAGEKEGDNPRVEYNIGAALAKGEKLAEALGAFGKVAAARDESLANDATYSQGVVSYKLAKKLAGEGNLEEAVKHVTSAVEANRKVLRQNHKDEDARFNLELSNRLKKSLEQQQQQDQQNEKNKDDEEQDDEQKKNEQQQNNDGQNQDEKQDQNQEQQNSEQNQEEKEGEGKEQEQKENEQQQEQEDSKDEKKPSEAEQKPAGADQQDEKELQDEDEQKAAMSVLNLLDDNDVEALKRMLRLRYGRLPQRAKDW